MNETQVSWNSKDTDVKDIKEALEDQDIRVNGGSKKGNTFL